MDTNQNSALKKLPGDILGGLSAMLVALPAAIAFGLVIYAPLGSQYTAFGALAGILGTIAIGLIAPLVGGTAALISAPCAPAAAVLAAFVAETTKSGVIQPEMIPVYLAVIGLLAGGLQLLFSVLGGGKFIKYIPYPVVAGYLSGVGILIFTGQLPKFLGVPKGAIWQSLLHPTTWTLPGVAIGVITIAVMWVAPRITKKIPGAILALITGILSYWTLSLVLPSLRSLEGNALVIGMIKMGENSSIFTLAQQGFPKIFAINPSQLSLIGYTALTLAVLISIDTLKTCVVLDALTKSRHHSNRELFGQGLANVGASMLFGMPGAGTMGATLVNLSSGGRSKYSGLFQGIFALLGFFAFLSQLAWVPVATLAGILIVIAFRMVDFKSFHLLTHRSTIFDFFVILSVIVTAVAVNLIAAAGVGVAMSILLFVRDQISTSIIRRKSRGNEMFSKKRRTSEEFKILLEHGQETAIFELQGSLFFGTTDQFYTEIRPIIPKIKRMVLDFERVRSVDYTASNILKQLAVQVKEQGGLLILAGIADKRDGRQDIRRYLNEVGLFQVLQENQEFHTLDEALEWIEEEMIQQYGHGGEPRIFDLQEIKIFRKTDKAIVDALRPSMKEAHFKNGEKIFKAGDTGSEVFFIRSGNIRIQRALDHDRVYTFSIFKKGDFFGDMAFLDHEARSADAVASGEVSLYVLTREEFDRSLAKQPEIASTLFEGMSRAIAHRLRQTNVELVSLRN